MQEYSQHMKSHIKEVIKITPKNKIVNNRISVQEKFVNWNICQNIELVGVTFMKKKIQCGIQYIENNRKCAVQKQNEGRYNTKY